MNTMNRQQLNMARASLVAVWLWTAVVSVQQMNGMSADLLRAQAAIPTAWHPWLIWGGVMADVILGCWMWLRPGRQIYLIALAMTLLMTAIASSIDPTLWLHPLGPLSKNLPIMALLWVLARADRPQASSI